MKNLIIRTISGIAFLAIMVSAILLGPLSYAVLFSLIILLMINEYINITGGRELAVQKILAMMSGLLLFSLSFLAASKRLDPLYITISAFPLLAIFIANLYRKEFNLHKFSESGERENNGYELFPFVITSVIYIALPFALTNLVVFNASADGPADYTPKILLVMFILLWANDVFAYCFGSTLGQKYGRRLFASISPKKSWIGFFGGLLGSAAIGYLISSIPYFEISCKKSIILAIIICIFGVWGDLAESQLKRNYGIKDSGNLIPGHGGMLDRFDAALIAFPFAVLYLLLLA